MTKKEHQLIDAYLDGVLEEADFAELEALLGKSAEARKRLRLLATIDEGLADLSSEPSRDFSEKVVRPQFGFRAAAPWAIAAAACIALLFTLLDFSPEQDTSRPETGGFSALLVDEAGAVFADGRKPEGGIRFAPGDYELIDGAVHMRFSNGADLVMNAPVEFSISDAFHVNVAHGNVRAIVPPSAHGFTIGSPGIDYEDLGTEFGVMVDRETGASEIHVFDGLVNVRDGKSSKLLSPAESGDSFRFDGKNLARTASPKEGAFISPGAIGLLRWEKWRREMIGNATSNKLIGFYTFEKTPNRESSTVGNEVGEQKMTDGKINQARWVAGRWPEKDALLFDRDTDFVEFDLPGEFSELSMAVWVKVDRFDHEVNAIFNSNGWDPGDLHWQVSRMGLPWTGLNADATTRNSAGVPIENGQWTHVAMVVSKTNRCADVFVNGKLADQTLFDGDIALSPGLCRLGNWLRDPEWPHARIRALRGRIDEFSVWNRLLSEDEIRLMVKIGQPAALWSVAPTLEFTQNTR